MSLVRICLGLVLCAAGFAQTAANLAVIHRIKGEAFKKGQVSEHLAALTDQLGPRQTASPQFVRAAGWCASKLREWGLQNVHLEKWGPIAQPWDLKRFSAHMTAPQYSPLIGFPLAWSAPTNGVLSGEPVLVEIRDFDIKRFREQLEEIKRTHAGKLRGKVVMTPPVRTAGLSLKALAQRYTDPELSREGAAPDPQVKKTGLDNPGCRPNIS
jgi:hypothetical protein